MAAPGIYTITLGVWDKMLLNDTVSYLFPDTVRAEAGSGAYGTAPVRVYQFGGGFAVYLPIAYRVLP